STNPSAVLAAALETVLRDQAVCCGKNSALEDTVLAAPPSLQELSAKLQGKHVLSDGRSVMVSAEYVPQSAITPDLMISALIDQHALLIKWKSRFYVLYGAISMKRSIPADSANLQSTSSYCWIHDSLTAAGTSNSTVTATIGARLRDS